MRWKISEDRVLAHAGEFCDPVLIKASEMPLICVDILSGVRRAR